jgi:hypothetical protein
MKFLLSMLTVLVSLTVLAAEPKKDSENPCHHPEGGGEAACTPAPKAADTDGVLRRGEKLSGAPKVGLGALLKSPQQHDGKKVLLEGTVRKACERKGCWMELAEAGDAKGPGVRVTFKNYGFFVPVDSAGKKAKVEGTVKVADLSDETAKHYESEGATVPRGTDGKPREIQLVASGVELR